MLEDLSVEELRKISLEKDKMGCATKKALEAQLILYELSGSGFSRNHNLFGILRYQEEF